MSPSVSQRLKSAQWAIVCDYAEIRLYCHQKSSNHVHRVFPTSTFREEKEARVSQKLAKWHALSFQELGAGLRRSLKLGGESLGRPCVG